MSQKLIVYSQKNCVGCRLIKDFLTAKGIAFEDRSITQNENHQKSVEKMGYRTVPVVVFPDQSSWAFQGQPSLRKLENLIGEKL